LTRHNIVFIIINHVNKPIVKWLKVVILSMDLKIDVTEVKKEKQFKLSGSYKGSLHFPEDNLEDCKVDVQYKLVNAGKGIYISGPLSLNVKLVCSRCLNLFEFKEQITLEDICEYPTKQEEVIDNFFIDDDILDLKELLRQKITLFLPLKPLCKMDCKGLCFKCGTDLNEGSCDCKVETDPIWSKLTENFNIE
jgi:uncharacterized protein